MTPFQECAANYRQHQWEENGLNVGPDDPVIAQVCAQYVTFPTPEPYVKPTEVVVTNQPQPALTDTAVMGVGFGVVCVLLAILIGMQIANWRHNR